MPVIFIPQLNKKISCDNNQNLMAVLQDNEIPVASSCLGDGICGKCVLTINDLTKIAQPNDLEQHLIHKHNWINNQRASCQVKVNSDIKVTSTYW